MLGARVEVDMHVVHGHFNRLQNPIRAVKGMQVEVEGSSCALSLPLRLAILSLLPTNDSGSCFFPAAIDEREVVSPLAV